MIKYSSLLLAVCLGVSAATLTVPAGGNLQAELNSANSGDTILLAPGARYIGNFTLPQKNGTAEIVIQTNTVFPNQRPTPAQAVTFAKILSANGGSTISVAPYAQHWKIRAVEIGSLPGVYSYGVVNLSSPTLGDENSYPAHVSVTRCYIHGDPVVGGKRGIALNGSDLWIENNYISGFVSQSQDAQAIAGWAGPGPFQILNNYLEGGQAIMFGGAAPSIPNLIPSNIVIENNYISRPMSWKGVWPVKNQLELKNAENVTVANNVIENNWVSAQNGYIVLFTVRTCDSANYPWAVVKNVNFSYNIIRNSDAGVNILGTDNNRSSCGGGVAGLTSDVAIANNLFESIRQGFVQLLSGAQNISVNHNTILQGAAIMGLDGTKSSGFVFNDNITGFGPYGVVGTGTIGALTTFAKFAPGTIYQHNAMIAADPSRENEYPTLNFFPASMDSMYFVNYSSGNYALSITSPYTNSGTDGKNVGADISEVLSRTATATSGNIILGH